MKNLFRRRPPSGELINQTEEAGKSEVQLGYSTHDAPTTFVKGIPSTSWFEPFRDSRQTCHRPVQSDAGITLRRGNLPESMKQKRSCSFRNLLDHNAGFGVNDFPRRGYIPFS